MYPRNLLVSTREHNDIHKSDSATEYFLPSYYYINESITALFASGPIGLIRHILLLISLHILSAANTVTWDMASTCCIDTQSWTTL